MTLIDPYSPTFEDHPYDPYPGSPGDLYDPQQFEPLPDVFDPADWSTGPVTSSDSPEVALLASFVESLREAYRTPAPDGSIILVDEDTAYVRTDLYPDSAQHGGDWYRLDGRDETVPTTLAEILDAGPRACDDPPRRPHTAERLYTADDVARLAAQFTQAHGATQT